jgi:hypothetical protein
MTATSTPASTDQHRLERNNEHQGHHMSKRQTAHGEFVLPTSAANAIVFFTPEGERLWVPGWNPTYPQGEPSETPGTVFTTAHGHTQIVWVIHHIDRAAESAAYSRITAGHHAGTVKVRCTDLETDRCTVTVDYDMTSLTNNAAVLDAYNNESFAAMMEDWATTVTSILGPENQP